MGRVWLVQHTESQALGALKILHSRAEPEERERFERERQILGELSHPAIVRLLDGGDHSGMPFLVMAYAPGENLEQRLCQGGRLQLQHALALFADLAHGLAYAHERGIHHRDIKAENVVLREDGWASLVDFGVALKRGTSRLTSAGFVMGTFAYLPPEVIAGEDRDPVKGDIYALGQLLFEALTGELAFRGGAEGQDDRRRWGSLTRAKLEAEALDPGSDFPEPLRVLVQRATAPDPADRLERAELLAESLASLLPAELQQEVRERRALGLKPPAGAGAGPGLAVAAVVVAVAACAGLAGVASIAAGLAGALL